MWDGGKVEKIAQGDYVFGIRKFTPFHAMRVLGDLQKVIAPVLGGAASSIKTQNPDVDIRNMSMLGNVLSDALNNLADKVSGEQLETAAKILLDPDYISVSPKGKQDFQRLDEEIVNEVFEGRVIDMFALMGQVFKVNYLDFSKLCSVPTGVREALTEIRQSFQAKPLTNSDS